MHVRFRLRLKRPPRYRFVLRRRSVAAVSQVPRAFRGSMRLRIPMQSVRAAMALAALVFLVGPVALTMVSARESGLSMPDLSRLARFVLPSHEAAAPARPTLRESAPVIRSQSSNQVAVLTGGNIDSGGPDFYNQSLTDIIAQDSLTQIAAVPEAGGLPAGSFDFTQLSLGPTAEPVNERLRDRYLWRAWLDDATEFHGQRTDGESVMVYQPGEGYAVLSAAAYSPMIQPADPRDRAPEEGSIYRDRRDRTAPGEEDAAYGESTERTTSRKSESKGSGGLAGLGNSFQPWDSGVVGDPFGPANALVSRVPGLRIERVVLFQGFSSNSYPRGQRSLPFANGNLGYDFDVGALATISWSRARPTGGFFMAYTPSHVRRMRFSEWTATDHQLELGAQKRFARWNVSFSNNTSVRGLQQVLFTPAVLRQVPDAPRSFDDLAAAAAGGQLSSDEIASVLTGAPVVDSQPETAFDQARVLSSSVGISASHTHSARLSSTVGVNASHYQALSNPQADDSITGLRGLNRSTSVGADAGMNYKVSQETSLGVSSNVRRNYSSYRDSTSVNTSASVHRRLGRRWSVTGGAGVGTVEGENPVAVSALGPSSQRTSTWIVNGGLNYSGRSHSFGFNGARTAGDAVGLGARTSHNATVHWNWARPGSTWGLQGQGSWYMMTIDGLPQNANGAFGGVGLVRQLSRETSFQANYSYQSFHSPFRGVVSNLSGHRVQVAWVWRPAGPPR